MDAQIARVEKYLQDLHYVMKDEHPVLFFNASTRIHRLSLNAAYSLLTSWALRAKGIPVRYLVCHRGMVQCVLGTRPEKPLSSPPCRSCIRVSQRIYPNELDVPVHLDQSIARGIQSELTGASIDEMIGFEYLGAPMGRLVLPGLRWVLRRHNLKDDEITRHFYRQYLGSAVSLINTFQQILSQVRPQAIVLFNGIFYPEAVLRYVASQRSLPVITHEVGLQPFSAFFSRKEATFREVKIDEVGELSEPQQAQLDEYLTRRFKGQFSMAGIRFWDDLGTVPEDLTQRLKDFEAIVPIFTNVIFDTSQIHANTLFSDMYLWLDKLIDVIDQHPEILFIIRAHPDEDRPGKASVQSVSAWIHEVNIDQRKNVVFVGPEKSLSSYELIELSKLVLVYNSSIGLEASILGKPVLCAGRARYTQADTVYFPPDPDAYWLELERLLTEKSVQIPESFQRNSRKFLYHELFRASLDLSSFIEVDPTLQGMVSFKAFNPKELQDTPSLNAILNGILHGHEFLLEE
jgi:hypothetical protein